MTKFNRISSVKIEFKREKSPGYYGSIEFSKLRTAFSISKYIGWATNNATLSIWNLSQENRNRIKDFGDKVTISAGYEDETGPQILFIGDTTQVSHSYASPDIVTTLVCGDGDLVLNNVRISVGFPPGTPVRQAIQDIAQQMGLSIIEFSESSNVVYEYGYYATGMSKDILDVACEKIGMKASVQNTFLHILPENGASNRPSFSINADNGMIGIPERFTDRRNRLLSSGPTTGWMVTTALNPRIIPGDKVNIISTRVDLPSGTFKVFSVRHEGDTYGANWRSTFEVILL